MSLSENLRRLADLIDGLETAGVDVETVSPAFEGDEGRMELTVSVADADPSVLLDAVEGASEDPAVESSQPGGASSTARGPSTDQAGASPTQSTDEGGSAESGDAGEATAETYPCTHADCDSVFGTEHGMKIHVGRMHDDGPDEEDGDRGPAESDDGSEAERDLQDVPPVAGVEAVDLKDAVEDADTLHEVATALDLDRDDAREVLTGLDLLELVHGRVPTKRSRDERKAEIAERMRENVDREAAN